MSEVINLREVSSRPSDDALFESLKTTLREHSHDRVVAVLEERAQKSEDALASSYTDPAMTHDEQIIAEKEFALNMMALQPMLTNEETPHNPLLPAFMRLARSRLAARMLRDPAERAVKRSIFFAPTAKRNRFAVSVSAAIRPYGDYDDRGFAVAVAKGEFDTTD